MAKMSFSASNRAVEIENFPKLKLENKESARIVVLHEPEAAYVHNLRAPKLINGVVQYKGEEMDFDFIGNPICLGDENTIRDRGGLDVKNCPACEAASKNPDMFQAPKRRFATHVYQYQTNGTTKAPVSAEGQVKVWAFADQKFGELIDIYETANEESDTPVGPTDLDLLLGPCENPMFQKFKILPGGKTAWKSNDNTKSRFEETVAANKSKDLYRYIGRKMSKDFMADKVDEVRRKWAQAKGQANETASDGLAVAERDLNAGLANLLDEPKATPKAETTRTESTSFTESKADSPDSFDDILASLEQE
jgi:hypothetical protein